MALSKDSDTSAQRCVSSKVAVSRDRYGYKIQASELKIVRRSYCRSDAGPFNHDHNASLFAYSKLFTIPSSHNARDVDTSLSSNTQLNSPQGL